MALHFSPTELTLVAAAINEKVAWLDSEYARLRQMSQEADAFTITLAGEDTNRIMRLHYAGILRRIEQQLDVPFVDHDEAVRVMESVR